MSDKRFEIAEISTPPSSPVRWVGWCKNNPNRVGRSVAKLWYDARDQIAKELGVSSIFDVEVIRGPE